jgi:hypothetical protein
MATGNVVHLFDSRGTWIAFRVDKFVFDPNGKWIGWLPWDERDVVDTNGNYLGSIFHTNRLFRFNYRLHRGYPGYPGFPGFPGFVGYVPLPLGADDVNFGDSDERK